MGEETKDLEINANEIPQAIKYWSLFFYHEELFSVLDHNMDTLYHPNQ
jgi:hypothetical protein